jgi:hypothetical protein
MLRTPSKPTLQLEGTDQQDWTNLQLVQGCFPFQIGLHKRAPGKTLLEQHPNPIGSIYVFYLVYGRHYQFLDFGGSIQIVETPVPPIALPGLPPTDNSWFDTFSGYDDGLISRLWGAGVWNNSVGICETLIQGIFDPFLVYATLPPSAEFPTQDQKPVTVPTPDPSPETTPIPPNSGNGPLPDRNYTDYTVTAALSNCKKSVGNNTFATDGPPETIDQWIAHGYLAQFCSPNFLAEVDFFELSASENNGGFVGYGNLAFGVYGYDRRVVTTYKSHGTINLTDLGDLSRCIILLIGTQTKTNGSLTAPTTDTIEITNEISAYAKIPYEVSVEAPVGTSAVLNPDISVDGNSISRSGLFSWDTIRVYDPEPL